MFSARKDLGAAAAPRTSGLGSWALGMCRQLPSRTTRPRVPVPFPCPIPLSPLLLLVVTHVCMCAALPAGQWWAPAA